MICWVVWRTGGRPLLAVKESCRGCCAAGPGEETIQEQEEEEEEEEEEKEQEEEK